MSTPLVSVLMTAYNRGKYIGEAIESVLASTYTNFELIIVDDRSTDNTVSIAQAYAGKDNRIHVHVNEHNLGDYPNRNKAATFARGKYLKYVDADDRIYPRGLEILVDCMEMFPEAGYGLCSFEQHQQFLYPILLKPAEAYRQHYSSKGIFSRAPLSAIIKRDVFEKTGGFAPTRMTGDYEMWHRLSLTYPVVIMQQGLIWYRKHDEQEMNHFRKFEFRYNRISLDYLRNPACPLDDAKRTEEQKKIIRYSSRRLLLHLSKGHVSVFKEAKSVLEYTFFGIIRNSFFL